MTADWLAAVQGGGESESSTLGTWELAERMRKENYKHHDIISCNYGRFSRGGVVGTGAAASLVKLGQLFLRAVFPCLWGGEESKEKVEEGEKGGVSSGFASATVLREYDDLMGTLTGETD